MNPILRALIPACILLGVAGAQGQPAAEPKILTNKDVVTLAKAGYTEDFIIDTIQSGRSRFDISAAGLADLAKEGLNERVVRVMAGVGMPAPEAAGRPTGQPSAPAAAQSFVQAAPYPEEMVMPGVEPRTRTQVVKPSRAGLAMASQTPYYESTSVLFGLFHKKVAVGAVPRADQIITPQSGGSGNSRVMANFPALVSPAGSRTRYVVIP